MRVVRFSAAARVSVVMALTLNALPAPAQDVPVPPYAQYVRSLPSYQPHHQVNGTIRSWGHGFLKVMMRYWEEDFRKFQPNVRFQDDLLSSAAAMAGLYSGRADLGVLAREITPPEAAAYEKVTGQKLLPVTVLTGSYGDPDKIMALGVFVNSNNPLARLSFEQLDAIFGAERRRGGPADIRTWGQLGLSGQWKKRPIHPYSGPAYETPGFVFSQTVMGGSVLWNCQLKQFDDVPLPEGKHLDGYQLVVDALAKDPGGIALTGAGYRNPSAKLLALAVSPDGPYIEPTEANVANRSYPLSRSVKFYINNGPKIPADPAVVEFLRYILSREGQEQALREGGFLPLTPQIVQEQVERLPND